MGGLPNRITAVAIMVGAPKQARLSRRILSHGIKCVTLKARITRFVNHADNSFRLHSIKIGAEQIVVRQIDYRVSGKRGARQRQNQPCNASEKKFHEILVALNFHSKAVPVINARRNHKFEACANLNPARTAPTPTDFTSAGPTTHGLAVARSTFFFSAKT